MSRVEVAISSPGMDFDFVNEAHPFSCLSAPSTPKRLGDYSFMSAPTSPSRVAEFYGYFNHFSGEEYEATPGSTPKSPKAGAANSNIKEDEFAFDYGVELEKASFLSTAEELFHGGKIKPLKPPPGLKLRVDNDSVRSPLLSPRSSAPRSPIAQGKRIIKEVFSPRRKKESDPIGTARKGVGNERGRERVSGLTSSSSRRGARSLSPYRVSGYAREDEEEEERMAKQQTANQPYLDSKASVSSTSSSSSSKGSSRKWRLKDLLLFRSSSEGRASDKDPLRKYSTAGLFRNRKHHDDQDVKNSNSRSTEGPGSVSKSTRRKGPRVSAHELHYTLNKAASEELKKKTFLPYRQGILGRLAYPPAIHALSH